MQSSRQLISVFGTTTVRGNAYNPITISDEDHRDTIQAQGSPLSGSNAPNNNSSNSTTTTATSSSSPQNASTTTTQYLRTASLGTSTVRGYSYNPIVVSDDEDEDDYSVRLFLSVFANMKEASRLPTEESVECRMVRVLVEEMMGC